MNKEQMNDLVRKEEQRKARIKRQNEAAKNKWETVSCRLPKGTKKRVERAGKTLNGLINQLIIAELDRLESRTALQASRMPEVKVKEYGEELSIAEIKAREWAEKHQTEEPDEVPQEAPKRNRVDDYINELRGYKPSEDPNSGYNNIMAAPEED